MIFYSVYWYLCRLFLHGFDRDDDSGLAATPRLVPPMHERDRRLCSPGCAGGVVTVAEIGDARTALFAVSFFRVRDGRIVAAEEYFAENGLPPFDDEFLRMRIAPAGVRD